MVKMGYLSKTGLDRFLSKLKNLFALKSDVPDWQLITDITVSGVTYHTYWPKTPTISNQVYGFAFHPSSGKLYNIYNDRGLYSIESSTVEAMTTTEIDDAIIAAGSIPDTQEYDKAMTTAEIDAAIAAAE